MLIEEMYFDAQELSIEDYMNKYRKYLKQIRHYMDNEKAIKELEELLYITCTYFENVSPEAIKGKYRGKEIVIVRHLFCFLAWSIFNQTNFEFITLKQIGRFINRDHSTVINSLRNYNDWLKDEDGINEIVEKITTLYYIK